MCRDNFPDQNKLNNIITGLSHHAHIYLLLVTKTCANCCLLGVKQHFFSSLEYTQEIKPFPTTISYFRKKAAIHQENYTVS